MQILENTQFVAARTISDILGSERLVQVNHMATRFIRIPRSFKSSEEIVDALADKLGKPKKKGATLNWLWKAGDREVTLQLDTARFADRRRQFQHQELELSDG